MKPSIVIAVVSLVLVDRPANAGDVQVAVASNFARPMERIAQEFEKDTGNRAVLTTGATGTFFAQIENGAPFEVLLAADTATPEKLVAEGFAIAETHFTYAFGVLVVWSAKPGYVDAGETVLQRGDFRHIAIANPKLAPYGAAAVQALGSLGLLDAVQSKLVQGQTVAQAFQFISSGNAELGFVALSQVAAPGAPPVGSYWVVPARLYAPLEQEGVLLRKGKGNQAASALCAYLLGPKAREIVRSYGYELPASPAR